MKDSIAKWSMRALCILLWLALAPLFWIAAHTAPGVEGWGCIGLLILLGVVWILMATSMGPTLWYVTEPLPEIQLAPHRANTLANRVGRE